MNILKQDDPTYFPPLEQALDSQYGLLCMGGDLSPARLLNAYERGIFPWFNEGEPIMWFSPNPRAILFFDNLYISKSLKKLLRQWRFEITYNQAFREVMEGCAAPRKEQNNTWITPQMINAYCQLQALGYGFSVECWQNNYLVGGIYGLLIHNTFFAESMFSLAPNASKVALVKLVQALTKQGLSWMDCQIMNPHLEGLGVTNIPRDAYLQLLNERRQKSLPDVKLE